MKKVLSVIMIIFFILFDIIKLPFVLLFSVLIFLFCLFDMMQGDKDWFNTWLYFNSEFICFTYTMRELLFENFKK